MPPASSAHAGKTKLLANACEVGVPFVEELVAGMVAEGVTVADCPISGDPPGARVYPNPARFRATDFVVG